MQERSYCRSIFAAVLVFLGAAGAHAQNLTIVNARILDGTGRVIERGTVVVRDGKIASVGTAGAPAGTAPTIDAGGKTVMPGLVDAHRHLVTGNPAQWLTQRAPRQMQEFLDAGFTTVLAAIDPAQAIEAKKRIEAGQMTGPRLYVGTFIPVAGASGPPPNGDPARTDPARGPLSATPAPAVARDATIRAVQSAKQAGYDYLKVVLNTTRNGPEIETLQLIIAEGKRLGLPTIVHAVSVRDTLAAIETKPDLLVHTPHIGNLGDDPAAVKKIVEANIPMTSTLAVFVPHFDEKGTALFRDAQPFPWNTLSSAGQGPVNARLLWEAGLTNFGYGTDTQWPPKETLADELRALRLVFSPQDIVRIVTKNAATATMHGSEFGTLEVGKWADIVIINGDPLEDSDALLNVVTTIKGGQIVFEKKN